MSPRWLGLRLWRHHFTPTADLGKGADFDPSFDETGSCQGRSRKRLGRRRLVRATVRAAGRLQCRAAAHHTHASSSSGFQGFGDYDAVGAGIEIEKDVWTGGLRWLSSNNAWDSGNGDYEAIGG